MTRSPEDDAIISHIFESEGGAKYTDDPLDPGGSTKFGITQRTLARYRGRAVTAQDVKDLQEPEARDIAYAFYFVEHGIDRITNPHLRYALVDFTYLFGADDSIPALQEIVGTAPDGKLGPKTAAAANAAEPRRVINLLAVKRVKLHAARVVSNETQLRFLRGWINRATSFIK